MIKPRRNPNNAAIYYIPDGYSTVGKPIMGIHAASEGFVRGFIRHADIDTAYCAVEDDAAAMAFHDAVRQAGQTIPIKAFPVRQVESLAEPGCLYLPGPGLPEFAWRRRHANQRGFSLCGVTHTTATAVVMDAVADFAVAPIQPWDALICTSNAVHAMVNTLLDDQARYLRDRLGASTFILPQMPVIPLGVDCNAFSPDQAKRREWRTRLGIAEDDIAVLFVGRLSFHAKAHPIPMYQALGLAAATSGRRFHLIQAGWFPTEVHETLYRDAGQAVCPDVNLIFLDGLDPDVRTGIWTAADIFTSLTDNIQETFGLTPVEAMAAGLPVVVSDWDGYRDTVRHGIDGFRIPTLMAPAPLGGDLAYGHGSGAMSYDHYIGHAAQFVAVDIGAAASAYADLAGDSGLRRRMGTEGARRAREAFDWKTIIGDYQALWAELAGIRLSAPESVTRNGHSQARPARPDPFHVFSAYPSDRLHLSSSISRTANGLDGLKIIQESPMVSFAASELPTEDESAQILAVLEEGPLAVKDIIARFPAERQPILFRGMVWLAKFGLVDVGVDSKS